MHTVTLKGINKTSDVSSALLNKMIPFSFEPYPDEEYAITVKDEYKAVLGLAVNESSDTHISYELNTDNEGHLLDGTVLDADNVELIVANNGTELHFRRLTEDSEVKYLHSEGEHTPIEWDFNVSPARLIAIR